MKLRPEEITSILKDRIRQFEVETDLSEVGTVLQVGDGIARVYGLAKAMAGEMLAFPRGVRGMVLNLEDGNVGVALLGGVARFGMRRRKPRSSSARISR